MEPPAQSPGRMRNRISLVGVGLLLWTLGLHFTNTHIWRIEEAQDTHRALDWIQATRRAEHRVNLLVGSSNTACSLDPRQLDSLGTVDRWYNLGQPGMADFELVDFALRLVEQVGQDEVDALFIEIIAQDAAQWVPDWRNVQIMEDSSALELLRMRSAIQEDDASGWDSVRLFAQFMLMKWSAPIHNWLHATPGDWLQNRQGFRTQNELRRLEASSKVAEEVLRKRRAQLERYCTYLDTGEIEGQEERARLAFPVARLGLLLEKAAAKGIQVHLFTLPTEQTEHLHARITQTLECPVFVPSCEPHSSIFVDPRLLRDPLHLNRDGAHEMGRIFLETYSSKSPH